MNQEWHQSAWQWLNHLHGIKPTGFVVYEQEDVWRWVAREKGVNDGHEKLAADVDAVGVHYHVSKGGARMGKEFDGYGTAVRERMKRVISQPAGWKPLNRKEESAAWIKWLIALIILFGIFELIFERIK